MTNTTKKSCALVVAVILMLHMLHISVNVQQNFAHHWEASNADSFCQCPSRPVKSINLLKFWTSYDAGNVVFDFSNIKAGEYVGRSSCNQYTTELGAGQRVLSYSYYAPPLGRDGQPREEGATSERYNQLFEELLQQSQKYYPGWRVRVYHNITVKDEKNHKMLCNLTCKYEHLDLCNVFNLHRAGNLFEKFPVGRFWRFSVIGDPTVHIWASRDIDSHILTREVHAVQEFLNSSYQFHIMRDADFHRTPILAGLWGGNNYMNIKKAKLIHKQLFDRKPSSKKTYDQEVLKKFVWPKVRNISMIHDAFTCNLKDFKGPGLRPWPTRRRGFVYVGYGPTKGLPLKRMRLKKCPLQCRPPDHQDWTFC